jgi:Fur family ferric uptake transcriptional regulator
VSTPARRSTKQRSAVSAVLDEADAFLSAQDQHATLRARGENVGLATVYRALQVLAEDGDVDVLRTDDGGEAVYRRCSTGHHHHLVCRRCGATVEIEGAEVEDWANAIAARYGFSDLSHTAEIFGICSDCSSSRNESSGPLERG